MEQLHPLRCVKEHRPKLMNGLYELGKEFQVAAQLTEEKCSGSGGGRGGDISMHRQCTGCVRRGQRSRKENVSIDRGG